MTVPNPQLIPTRPKLRLVEPSWVLHLGQRYLHLRDPIGISESTIMLPESVAPLLGFLDGSRDLGELRAMLALRVGLSLTDADLRSLIGQLDQALMIENGGFRDALQKALIQFRSAEHRPMSHAGAVYPRSAASLEAAIDDWCAQFPPESSAPRPRGDLIGMVCPHIDYNRGHATYAKLLGQADDDLKDIETIVVLGTDHYGGLGRLTPTRQSYATPYGTVPTDVDVVNELVEAVGSTAFDEEIHHTTEHSIELALVWLHHFMRGREFNLVPVLCGSFHHLTNGSASPEHESSLEDVAAVLSDLVNRRRTLIVAAGDLAHVGPAFGDRHSLDAVAKVAVSAEDGFSIEAICSGDAEAFLDISQRESDRRKLCGLPPIYLMLRALCGSNGVHIGYAQCPADPTNGSIVSIVGALLYR